MDNKLCIIREYPHFLDRKAPLYRDNVRIYHSKKVLGQIYDIVKNSMNTVFGQHAGGMYDIHTTTNTTTKTTTDKAVTIYINPKLTLQGYEIYTDTAIPTLHSYNQELIQLMHRFEIQNECYLTSGYVINMTKKRMDTSRHSERIGYIQASLLIALSELKRRYLDIFYTEFVDIDYTTVLDSSNSIHFKVMQKAACWYQVTYMQNRGNNSDLLSSFGWIAYSALCKVYEYNTFTCTNSDSERS